MSHEDVKLEACQAAISPKLDCCTEPTLKASTLQCRHHPWHSLQSMGTLVDGVTRAGVMVDVTVCSSQCAYPRMVVAIICCAYLSVSVSELIQ